MTYSSNIRIDYTLADAFQALGVRLFGSEWSGYEVLGERHDDPSEQIAARAPLEAEMERLNEQRQAKQKEQKEAFGKDAIFRANCDLKEIDNRRGEIVRKLSEIGDVRDSEIKDHERWLRFETASGTLIKAFGEGKISIYCPFGQVVPDWFWREFPEGFHYDILHSLVFWPDRHSSMRMGTARIREREFDDWLHTVLPLVDHELEKLTDEQRAEIWFREEVKNWDGKTTRDQYRNIALDKFPELTVRGFKRIWDKLATKQMKKPGARAKTNS